MRSSNSAAAGKLHANDVALPHMEVPDSIKKPLNE